MFSAKHGSLNPGTKILPAVAIMSLAGLTPMAAMSTPQFLVDGSAAFVVSHVQYALADEDSGVEACPDGLSKADRDRGNRGAVFLDRPDLQQRPDETESEFTSRTSSIAYEPGVTNLCMNPELGSPDPDFRTVSGSNVPVHGIDLTGHVAKKGEPAAPKSCAYDSFTGVDGASGVDNQFYRVVGCTRGYQPTGLANQFATEMLSGSWGLVVTLDDIDDLVNDDRVTVGIYANADPIVLSPDRDPLGYATYTAHQDPRYQASTTGRIENGVLSTDPVEVRFFTVLNAMYIDQVMRDARLEVTINSDGVMSGYLAGYVPVENAYDVNFGFRDARANYPGSEEPGPFRTRSNSAIGKSNHMGYSCPGIYHALHENADGHPDPDTGRCTTISTQYQIEALPAFVVGREKD